MSATEHIAQQDLVDPGFHALSELAYSEAGLVLSSSKAAMIRSRLRHRLRDLSLDTLEEYCDYVRKDHARAEHRHMISALTTNVSGFFREPHHFDQLQRDLVPQMVDRLKSGQEVRIWSAGCSNGQEPYSIAMLLCEADPVFETGNFRILATDIDPKVIEHASQGRYSEQQVSGVSPERRSRFFRAERDASGEQVFQVTQNIRHLVVFRELNLIAQWPIRRQFDAIFCRNVVIYFDLRTQEQLWPRFSSALRDDGIMFVGHSERIGDTRFKPIGSTSYSKTHTSSQFGGNRQEREG